MEFIVEMTISSLELLQLFEDLNYYKDNINIHISHIRSIYYTANYYTCSKRLCFVISNGVYY
jgi:hypothetical protein